MTWLKKYFYFFPVLFYLPALGNFFSADDWFHLRITHIDTLQQFLNFFSFSQTPQTASFYRPLSTQVFYFIFQTLFGLNSAIYYLFGLTLFAYILYLIKKLLEIYLPPTIHNLPSIVYGLSVSNFTRIYFVSAFQELFLVIFSLLTLINFKSKPKLSLLFFVLALLSKETAIVLPALIFLLNLKDKKSLVSTIYDLPVRQAGLRSTILISVVYLYFRLFHFGLAEGDSYLWNLSPIRAVNTLMWYALWSVGAPELLVDYIGSGLRPIPRFFVDYPNWWVVIVFPLLGIIASSAYHLLKNFKKLNSYFWIFIVFFVISLLPVLFLPSHKFALELGLPLVGFSISLSILLKSAKPHFFLITFVIFLVYNLSMNYLTYTRHYSVSRGQISKKVYEYFSQKYPTPPENQYFEFVNDAQDYGEIWGQSKQISQSLSNSDFFKVLYRNPDYVVYYQDIPESKPKNSEFKQIHLSTKQFLNK